MQIIIISPNNKTHKHWHLSPLKIAILALATLTVIGFLVVNTYQWYKPTDNPNVPPVVNISQQSKQSNKHEQAQVEAYYAKRLGSLQAEAIRLRALTKKLAEMSGLDSSDAMFESSLAQGGIDHQSQAMDKNDFEDGFGQLTSSFAEQSLHLGLLQDYIITDRGIQSAIPTGRPINDGWISSYYGNRVDPFNGKKAFHSGLDFAAKEGSEVMAAAEGIVSWHGKRGGYGEMIEIDHGNGYQTRYAHNKELTVGLGERVKKGQTIAKVGSTGRSTGPHVHFEVLRDGRTINPYNFVK